MSFVFSVFLALRNESLIILKQLFGWNVPYYKKRLVKVTCLDDLSKIEFLTKDKIRNYSSEIKAINFQSNRFYSNATSGSTGESLFFYTDALLSSYLKLSRYPWGYKL